MTATRAPRASVDAATVRDRFNLDWATSQPVDGIDTYWWYAISIRVDPNEVIADDGTGHLWSVPFTTDGENQVTFGAPTEVRQTFVPAGVGDGKAAMAMVGRRGQPRSRPACRSRASPAGRRRPLRARGAPPAVRRVRPQQEQGRRERPPLLRPRGGLP